MRVSQTYQDTGLLLSIGHLEVLVVGGLDVVGNHFLERAPAGI